MSYPTRYIRFEDLDPSAADVTVGYGVHAIYVGTGGDLVVEDKDGTQVTFKVLSGQLLEDIAISTIKAAGSGTTAAALIGLRRA